MPTKNITSTEFAKAIGVYLDAAAKGPVFITKHQRPSRVILDIEEYNRLKQYDTRKALYPHELSDELKAELENAEMAPEHAHLDKLME